MTTGETGHHNNRETADLGALELDDDADRDELRSRYYGLLQELRVLLPGAQVLVAFLLTAPFANRFKEVDQTGRGVYGVSLMSGMLAIIAYVSPIALHRVGSRTARAERLQWSIRMMRVGLFFLSLSLISSLFLIARFIYDEGTAVILASVLTASMVLAWVALPSSAGRRPSSK